MNLVAFQTIVVKEITRWTRIWSQTLLPPAITMTLYFVIFGNLIGSRVGEMDGFGYMEYIVPGLIMMSVIRVRNLLISLVRPSGLPLYFSEMGVKPRMSENINVIVLVSPPKRNKLGSFCNFLTIAGAR